MTESSVLEAPGGRFSVIREQALHLNNMLEEYPSFSLQIVRMPAKLPYIETDFTVFKMPGRQPDRVYQPYGDQGSLRQNREAIADLEHYWREAREAALSVEQTKKFLHDLTALHDR